MTYFVTGATGFIGRHLVEQLLEREGDIYVLVREGSRERLDELIERWDGSRPRQARSSATCTQPQPRASTTSWIAEHRGHDRPLLPPRRDLRHDRRRRAQRGAQRRRHAQRRRARQRARGRASSTTSPRSPPPARYKGLFREDMFDEGQKLPVALPPHEVRVRADRPRARPRCRGASTAPRSSSATRRPARWTRSTGPTTSSRRSRGCATACREWVPLVGPELGYTNIVPVDYVAAAMDHIAHQPDLDGQAFHLIDPKPQRSGEVLNTFAKAAHAPQLAMRIDKRLTDALPKGVVSMLMKLPRAARTCGETMLADFGIPEEVLEHVGFTAQFDTRDTERALAGLGHRGPAARHLRRQALGLLGAQPRPGPVQGPLASRAPSTARPSSSPAPRRHRPGGRAEDRAGRRHPAARRARAWTSSRRPRPRSRPRAAPPTSTRPTSPTSTRSTRSSSACSPTTPSVDILVNNAGRSIRRSIALSHDRFHDFERTMQLNYFGAIRLIMGLLPHMRERELGHIVNVSSIGVQTNPPRFSAYVASKAALDAWTRVVGSEVVGDGITFTTIHMPLVRTPMIAPTKIYDTFPTITPGRGRRPRSARRSARKPKHDQHAPGHVRRGRPTRSRPRRSTRSCTWPTRSSPTPPPRRARRTRTRRRRWSRSRWRT